MDIILKVVEYFNIGKTMSVEQARQTAEMLIEKYYYLKPSELKYCFNNGKMGLYGRIYDRIDGGVFFDWIDQYSKERDEACELHQQKQAGEFKSEEYKKESSMLILPLLKQLDKSETKPSKALEIESKGKDYEVHQEWFKEWDRLFKEHDIAGRFIDYKGKIISQEEFFDIKLAEQSI